MLAPDAHLKERYRILHKIGGGGFGHVYKAIDEVFGCPVAIKETKEEVASHDKLRKAFEREAKLLRNLKHECLPRVTDYFFQNEAQFLVMDFIEGEDLAFLLKQRLARGGPFPVSEILPWADRILSALEYLHSRPEPIIHRDIKPSNIKLANDGDVYLLDFGLAKGVTGQMSTIREGESSFSLAAFTREYAPIEQLQDAGTQPVSDVYALAATLYHLLTGQFPVAATKRDEAIQRGLSDPLRPAHQVNPAIPLAVSQIISQAMSIRWWDRLASAKDMRVALAVAACEIIDAQSLRVSGEESPSPAGQVNNDNIATLAFPHEAALSRASAPVLPTQMAMKSRRFSKRRLIAGLSVLIIGAAILGTRLVSWQWLVHALSATTSNSTSSENPISPVPGTPTDLHPRLVGTHKGVWSLAFSPDGSLAASASNDNTIILWDTRAWQPKLSEALTGHEVAFSPDGNLLASGGADKKIRLWDGHTGKPIYKAQPFEYSKPVYRLAFSADSSLLASFSAEPGNGDKDIQVWDLRSNFSRTLKGHEDALTAIAFSPHGNVLFSSGHDNTLRSWNLAEQPEGNVLKKYAKPLMILVFSPNGMYLACGSSDKSIKLWAYQSQTSSWKELPELEGLNDSITSLAFSPDNKTLISTTSDKKIQLWDVTSSPSKPVLLSQSQNLAVQKSSAFSRDGLLTGGDNMLWLWQ